MRYVMCLALLWSVALVGCIDDTPCDPDDTECQDPDGKDDGLGSGSGSGSAAATIMEPSPQDNHLELVVAGASMVIVFAPIRGSRRRRAAQ